jgi:hypothetical protein
LTADPANDQLASPAAIFDRSKTEDSMSRRHPEDKAKEHQTAARERWLALHGKEAKRVQAETFARYRLLRGDLGQLKRLDLVFGAGQGAAKERAKLQRRIEAAARRAEDEAFRQAKLTA